MDMHFSVVMSKFKCPGEEAVIWNASEQYVYCTAVSGSSFPVILLKVIGIAGGR